MTYNLFFEKVVVNEKDKNNALHFMNLRGIHEHIFVANYLQSLKVDTVKYEEVATAFRYDKRIRRIIYKYIGMLEEILRAYLVNKYSEHIDKLSMKQALSGLMSKYHNLYEAVNMLTFGQLIGQIKALPQDEKFEVFNVNTTSKNLDALIGLRNEVNHNRFLLHNKSLRKCRVGKIDSSSLWANIINLKNHLPNITKSKFVEEIEDAAKVSSENKEYQCKWILLENVIIGNLNWQVNI